MYRQKKSFRHERLTIHVIVCLCGYMAQHTSYNKPVFDGPEAHERIVPINRLYVRLSISQRAFLQ